MRSLRILMQILFCISALALLHSTGGKRYHNKLMDMRNRMIQRRGGLSHEGLKPRICYDLVGCFPHPPSSLPLKRPPEHPNVIRTRFLLYTRSNQQTSDLLKYADDLQSIETSNFNASKSLKVLIHGYKGSSSDVGVIIGSQRLLDLEDTNVLMVDWTRGAGTTYASAVANTELVGRQFALLLLDMIDLGLDPNVVHVIGFSLGAHVAGCASEVLKRKNILIARITGLDPASPFFRHHLFREKSRKLDASDAQLVDVVHTDGSEDFADGFGLLKPIGHVDFFPNGGREQPGCVDVKNSVVVSHLKEELLGREIACSHLRAWQLFMESLLAQNGECKFTAWPCAQGGASFAKGTCFPYENTEWSQELGYGAGRGPLGIYYLATREEAPFCGIPIRASVRTSEGAGKTSGILFFKVFDDNSTTVFQISCSLSKRNNEWMMFYDIAATKFQGSIKNLAPTITGTMWYRTSPQALPKNVTDEFYSDTLLVNKLAVEDRKGNRWEYCSRNTAVSRNEINVELHNVVCKAY